MTVVVFEYKGRCKGGPWDGQYIEAERSIIEHKSGGLYQWWHGEWKWRPLQ